MESAVKVAQRDDWPRIRSLNDRLLKVESGLAEKLFIFLSKKRNFRQNFCNDYNFLSIRFARYGAYRRIIRKTTLFG